MIYPKVKEYSSISNVLETERLILRPMTSKDLPEIFAMRSDAEMMRFIKPPENLEQTKRWLEYVSSRWLTKNVGFRAVVDKTNGQVVGWCGLWILPETGETELGYAIHKSFQRKGLAVEAARATLVEGFDKLGVPRIAAIAMPENNASRRVMEKVGLRFERFGWFYERECAYYALDRADFLALSSVERSAALP